MQRLGKKLRDSVFGALRCADPPHKGTEVIRSAMLQALGKSAGEEARLERHLLFAPDVEALWHIRPALMNVVAARDGESNAQQSMDQLTAMFNKGNNPRGGTPRRNGRNRH